jgi:diguanylate cyclase (GGDEF)-like protein
LLETIIILAALGAITLITSNYYNNSFYKHLFELEEAFEGELDFIHLSKNILTKVMLKTSASAGMVYWFDEVQNEFKLKTVTGIPTEKINQVILILRQSKGIMEQLQNTATGLILEDLKLDLTGRGFGELGELGKNYRSLMAVPLTIQKKFLGVLIIFKARESFNKKQLKLLTLFAPRLAVWLDNVRLYQLATETALENAKLYVNICKLYQKATLDELTGLYNRNFLMQRIKEEYKKAWRFKQPLSIIFADLDYFKKVNDQYGHQVGDQLLSEFGSFLKNSVRDYDVPCRFGGEEFIILLPQTNHNDAYDLAERLRDRTANLQFCGTKNLKITASFGVSALWDFSVPLIQMDDQNLNVYVDNLIAWADEALYQAKKAGRNKVEISNNLQPQPETNEKIVPNF